MQTYFRETYDQSSSEYVFKTVAQTAFFNLLHNLANASAQDANQLKDIIDAILMSTKGIGEGSLFSKDKEGFQFDLLMKRIRHLIVQVMGSQNTTQELRVKCTEMLMRVGMIAASPEDLILASQYQYEFKIDISRYLGMILNQSEVFEEPKSTTEESGDLFKLNKDEKKRIQNKCDYEGPGNRQHGWDKLACDGAHYFTFAEDRGLCKATRDAEAKWKIAKCNTSDEAKGLKFPTFLTHQDVLYIRHGGCTDTPFQQINKTEMTIDKDAPKITYGPDLATRFKFTNTTEDCEENDDGKRWMRVAPMASDGYFIYTLVLYRQGDKDSTRKSTVCEVYELKDNVISYVKEQKLFDEDDKPWIGKESSDLDHGGYLDFGSLTCNGQYLVWHARKNVHIFDLKTGKRMKKQNMHGGIHLSCYDAASSNFYSCDADVYSWLDEWKIKGFKTIVKSDNDDEDKEARLPPLPVILDEPKSRIKKNQTKVQPVTLQLNLFSQLIGGQMEADLSAEAK